MILASTRFAHRRSRNCGWRSIPVGKSRRWNTTRQPAGQLRFMCRWRACRRRPLSWRIPEGEDDRHTVQAVRSQHSSGMESLKKLGRRREVVATLEVTERGLLEAISHQKERPWEMLRVIRATHASDRLSEARLAQGFGKDRRTGSKEKGARVTRPRLRMNAHRALTRARRGSALHRGDRPDAAHRRAQRPQTNHAARIRCSTGEDRIERPLKVLSRPRATLGRIHENIHKHGGGRTLAPQLVGNAVERRLFAADDEEKNEENAFHTRCPFFRLLPAVHGGT